MNDNDRNLPPRKKASKEQEEMEQNKNESKPIPTPPVWKNAEDIINNGTVYQKAVIYLNNIDGKRTYHFPALTEEQNERLKADLYSEDNFSDAIVYTRTYNAFIQFGKWMELAQMTYEKEATRLLGLIDMWEGLMGYFLHWKQKWPTLLATVPDGHKPPFYGLPNWERYHGAQIFLEADGRVTLDEGDFREEIRLQTERTAKALSVLKGYIEPLWNYITDEGEPTLWSILPLALERLMEYPDYIPEQNDPEKERYFRFRLRQRRERGETITEEDEAMAIIPDYNEQPTDLATEAYAKQLLTDTFYIWEVEKRNKGEKKKKRRYSKE